MKIHRSRQIDTVFVLIIFCIFAMSVLIVLSLSGNIYKNTVEVTQDKYDEHISLSFVWSKVKNGDMLEKVYIADFHDQPALCLEEEYNGVTYLTYIYQYDGWIRELFFERGIDLFPQDGVPIISAELFDIELIDNRLIKVSAGADSLLIYPRGTSQALAAE